MNVGPGSGPESAPPRPTVKPALALGVIGGALALDVGSLNVINAALPVIGARFELDTGSLQWVMTSYSLTFAGFLLLSGRMADVLGRRFVFTLGLGLFSVAALAGAVAPNAGALIAARALQGIGAALSGPAALALLSEVFPAGSERNRAFGVYAAVGSVSASGGLVLGGVLTELLTWRSVFAVSAIAGGLVMLGVKPALPKGVRRPHSLDLSGATAVTAGLILLVLGFSRVVSSGWGDPVVLGCLVTAVVLLVGFVLWEGRAEEPLIPLKVFRAPSVKAASLTAAFSYTIVVGLLFFAPLYLQDVLSYSPFQSALAVLPLSCAVFVVATYLATPLLARFGQRPLLIGGLLVVALGMASWSWTTLDGEYWYQMLPGVVAVGIGMGVAFPAMTAAGLTGVPAEQHGVAGAINVVAQQIGASVGLVLLVVISVAAAPTEDDAGKLSGYHTAYLAAAALAVVCAAVIALGRRWEDESKEAVTVAPPVPQDDR